MSTTNKRRIKYLALLAPALLIAIAAALVMSMSKSAPASALDAPPCSTCHNDTTLIDGKKTAWAESGHGTGTAFAEEGGNKSCAGCHSGGTFSARIAAGLQPNQVTAGDPNPTKQDCRACHQIHTTFTGPTDWALETTAPVSLYIYTGVTFDGGKGNLCANCHQPRTKAPTATGGTISVSSTHWGPHHGPQSSFMLGTGGSIEGTSAAHYQYVTDTCAQCHMGDTQNHSFEPSVTTCQACHAGATSFDIDGVQTTVQTKSDSLKGLLVTAGMLTCTTDPTTGVESCSPVVGTYPEAKGKALWDYIVVAKEDRSKGVHNPAYANALLDNAITNMSTP